MRKVEILPTRDCEAGNGPGLKCSLLKNCRGGHSCNLSCKHPVLFVMNDILDAE